MASQSTPVSVAAIAAFASLFAASSAFACEAAHAAPAAANVSTSFRMASVSSAQTQSQDGRSLNPAYGSENAGSGSDRAEASASLSDGPDLQELSKLSGGSFMSFSGQGRRPAIQPSSH